MENENKPPNAQQNSATKQSAPTIAVATPQTKEHCSDTEKNKNSLKDPLFWLLFGTLIATGTAAYFTGRQSFIAEDQEKKQLRAYVGIVGISINAPAADDPNYKATDIKPGAVVHDAVSVIAEGAGQTPSYQVTGHINWLTVSFGAGLPPGFSFPDYEMTLGYIRSRATLNPGKSITFTVPLVGAEIQRIKSAKEKHTGLFFYGHVDYIDIFGTFHANKFCYLYIPKGGADNEPEGFTTCTQHNGENPN